jgi:hypothetical protein
MGQRARPTKVVEKLRSPAGWSTLPAACGNAAKDMPFDKGRSFGMFLFRGSEVGQFALHSIALASGLHRVPG